MPPTTMVCSECREKQPFLLSCIHTFAPRVKTSPLGTYDRDEEMRVTREEVERMQHPSW